MSRHLTALGACLALIACDAAADETVIAQGLEAGPAFADTVVEAPGATGEGFGVADNAVNGVRGGGIGKGSFDVFSLGHDDDDSWIVLRWSGRRVTDGPGADFAVFENPFLVGSGPKHFMDPLVVEVSRDGTTWISMPHDYATVHEQAWSGYPDDWDGFAGVHPVLLHEENNPVDPFDTAAAGGDVFDLADLDDSDPEAAAIRAEGFVYLRLVSAATRINPDSGELFPKDPASDGPDIDGVYARHLKPEG